MVRGKRKKRVQAALPTPPSGVTYETESAGFFDAVDKGESAQWEQGHFWSNLVKYKLYADANYKSALVFLK